jgi:chromate transporter
MAGRSTDLRPQQAPSLARATLFWLKVGFISFGGPAGQIAILHQELVERRRWISEQRFLHALNFCMLLPGPEAQQLATYVGWLLHRVRGGLIAGGLFVLPSLFILIGLSWIYVRYGHVAWIAALLYGIKPAVTAIVLQAAHRIAKRALTTPLLWIIAALAFIAIAGFGLPFPAVIALAALTGAVGGRIAPSHFRAGGGHGGKSGDHLPALIDDDTPTPAHALFTLRRLIVVVAAGLLLWLIPMALLAGSLGWTHTLTQMAWFFTKAALLTFGGAYAVLPYVNQGAVLHYHWLQPGQMIDGLALGETTPGPLIMVVAFVGFVGGYASPEVRALFSPGSGFAAGAIAATLVTWYTFLPSFVFIFAGGPLAERTHGDLKVTAPLTAITAAVVGVILNLALFFGFHVLWPQGWSGPFDGISAAIAAVALVALLRFRVNVMAVIAGAAVLGLMVSASRSGFGY